MFLTYNKLIQLGNDYGRINFKGWTISSINECVTDVYGQEEISKATDEDLHGMITSAMQEWKEQDEYAEMMQRDAMREGGWL